MIDILVLLVNLLLGAWLCFVYTDMNYILLEEEVDKIRSSYPEVFRMSPDDIEKLSPYFKRRIPMGWRKFAFQYFWNQPVSLGHKNFMYYRYAISVAIVMVLFVVYKLLVLYTGMSPVLDLVFYVGTPLLAWVFLYIPYGTRSKNWYIKDLKKTIFEIDQALCHREVTTNRKVRDHKYGLNVIK